MESTEIYRLPDVLSLLKQSWKMVRSNLRDFLGLSALFLLASYALNLIEFYFVKPLPYLLAYLIQALIGIVLGLGSAYVVSAIIYRLSAPRERIKTILKKSWQIFLTFFFLEMLANIIILGAFLPLIIPGFILMIAFAFLSFVLVLEKKKWLNALLRSSDLTSGFRWALLGRFLLFGAIMISVALPLVIIIDLIATRLGLAEINLLSSFVAMLIFFPLGIAFSFNIFSELKKLKPLKKFNPSEKGKNIYGFVFLWGLILIALAVAVRFSYPGKNFFDLKFFEKKLQIEYDDNNLLDISDTI